VFTTSSFHALLILWTFLQLELLDLPTNQLNNLQLILNFTAFIYRHLNSKMSSYHSYSEFYKFYVLLENLKKKLVIRPFDFMCFFFMRSRVFFNVIKLYNFCKHSKSAPFHTIIHSPHLIPFRFLKFINLIYNSIGAKKLRDVLDSQRSLFVCMYGLLTSTSAHYGY
jgi:hypothetical protein